MLIAAISRAGHIQTGHCLRRRPRHGDKQTKLIAKGTPLSVEKSHLRNHSADVQMEKKLSCDSSGHLGASSGGQVSGKAPCEDCVIAQELRSIRRLWVFGYP
jgi:hypothetical protein